MIDPKSIDIAQRRGRPDHCARQAIYFVGAEWSDYVECPISATVRRASVCRDIKVVRRRRTSFRMRNLRNICICRLVDGRQGYKILKDGTRRITAFMMPGDSCDLHVTILCAMDHGITGSRRSGTASRFVANQDTDRIARSSATLARALEAYAC